jgi:hypothetical protein
VKCGSFSFNSPELADKVYQLDDEMNNIINGQEYLCTWLSGNPLSEDKIWVDRYYYPDLVSKEDALSGRNIFNGTYEEMLENIIMNNVQLKSSVTTRKIFDKRSDLCFQPNKTYRYERLNVDQIQNTPTIMQICDCTDTSDTIGVNYFKDLNNSGKFTIGFYFVGDSNDWIVESNRNSIDGGVRFVKSGGDMTYQLSLYDSSNGSFTVFTATMPYTPLKENFVYFTIDALNGVCYFYLNNDIVEKFSFPIAQFFKKKILFGDFYLTTEERPIDRVDIFKTTEKIYDPILIKDYIDEDFAFYLQLSKGKFSIQDIQITLPCGMRNSTDNVDILNSVCSSSIFKSSNFNIRIKNVPVSNENIRNSITKTVESHIQEMTPVTSDLNNLEFDSFK